MAVGAPVGGFGCHVDAKLKNMMKDLGEAINQSISDSDEIAEVISRIKAGGYDVFLVLEATIGFNQRDEDDEPAPADYKTPPQFELTGQDAKFLKSLRISVEDDH
jgi:hypothetical protein